MNLKSMAIDWKKSSSRMNHEGMPFLLKCRSADGVDRHGLQHDYRRTTSSVSPSDRGLGIEQIFQRDIGPRSAGKSEVELRQILETCQGVVPVNDHCFRVLYPLRLCLPAIHTLKQTAHDCLACGGDSDCPSFKANVACTVTQDDRKRSICDCQLPISKLVWGRVPLGLLSAELHSTSSYLRIKVLSTISMCLLPIPSEAEKECAPAVLRCGDLVLYTVRHV